MTFINKNASPAIYRITLFAFFLIFACLPIPSSASMDLPLLAKHIAAYNLEHLKQSLSDCSYRGEEGLLRINPETGRSFGLKVLINQDYLKAMELYDGADDLIEKITDALATREKEKFPGEHVKKIAEMSVRHNKATALAWQHLLSYRSKLKAEIDDRLDRGICSRLLEKLLQEDVKTASYNLRDALGNSFNRCQALDTSAPLNFENIEFVNYVFYRFTKDASKNALSRFNLDRCHRNNVVGTHSDWKTAPGKSSARFSSVLASVFKNNPGGRYPVDELLFLALIRQESAYDPRNVSYVGAAGLTQIMPQTAINLGMENIFLPPYFREAGSLLERERRLKHKAKDLILEITEENSLKKAKQARNLMLESLDCGDRRKKLYVRYKQELLNANTDDRLDPCKAISYGLKYFSQMMKIQKGDISLALASYNAGPHRVKQYKGIPPFKETIEFRNKVLQYYRIYQSRVSQRSSKQAATY